MTRILLLGREGQVGWELTRLLPELGKLNAFNHDEADLTDFDHLRKLIHDIDPTLIINAAAYTDVDRAELEPSKALTVNGEAPGVLAEEARHRNALFVHFSTDYVFDGKARAPYRESDIPRPINTYGRTKLFGERAIDRAGGRNLILRTSWVYSTRRESFVSKVVRWAHEHEELSIVDDQQGSPTWCRTVARATMVALKKLLRGSAQEELGLFHVVCRGAPSRFELAKAVLDLEKMDKVARVRPVKSSEFPSPALRPEFSALDPSKFETAFDCPLPSWEDCLSEALSEEVK